VVAPDCSLTAVVTLAERFRTKLVHRTISVDNAIWVYDTRQENPTVVVASGCSWTE
jgi:hypothetical protein